MRRSIGLLLVIVVCCGAAAASGAYAVKRGPVTLAYAPIQADSANGALVTYAVTGGGSARARLPKDAGDFGTIGDKSALRLVPIPGEVLPIGIVVLRQCGRDCSEAPYFFHRTPRKSELTMMDPLFVDSDRAGRVVARWTVRRATLIHQVTSESAIPIRDKSEIRYTYVERTDGQHEIVGTDTVTRWGSDEPSDKPLPLPIPVTGCFETREKEKLLYVTTCANP
jgi:hypothetical protein